MVAIIIIAVVMGIMFFMCIKFLCFIYKENNASNEIKSRYAQIISDAINAPRQQRLCESAGLYHLPAKCKCGFFGKSSDEMEKHFDECEMYSGAIMNLIFERNKSKK